MSNKRDQQTAAARATYAERESKLRAAVRDMRAADVAQREMAARLSVGAETIRKLLDQIVAEDESGRADGPDPTKPKPPELATYEAEVWRPWSPRPLSGGAK